MVKFAPFDRFCDAIELCILARHPIKLRGYGTTIVTEGFGLLTQMLQQLLVTAGAGRFQTSHGAIRRAFHWLAHTRAWQFTNHGCTCQREKGMHTRL